ncbi:helix-turn-helix domain-containing protein [Pararhizobium gei]|uniref:helix-turn-helix domain-containing protein n=1 Tax=Pararhizobium gei TaxID=1395951 RepID=UPI0023DC162C|nr:helix-turn-helix domain-containing protein [Rhizobium gei]
MMQKAERLPYPEIISADLIDRIKEVYDCRTDRQLAARIGVDEVIFTRWRNRNTFHKEVVFAVAFDQGISLNYLLFGRPENAVGAILTVVEMEAVKTICKNEGLTESGLVRFSLSLYREIGELFAAGQKLNFKGSGQTPSVLSAPILGLLRARHSVGKTL